MLVLVVGAVALDLDDEQHSEGGEGDHRKKDLLEWGTRGERRAGLRRRSKTPLIIYKKTRSYDENIR